MPDVRINGQKAPILNAILSMDTLYERLETMAAKQNGALTGITINGSAVDMDEPKLVQFTLGVNDTVEVRVESSEKLSLESLQVAQEMAKLLLFDMKVVALDLYEGSPTTWEPLQTLVEDCRMFLSLAFRPLSLLKKDPQNLSQETKNALEILNQIATDIEKACHYYVLGDAKLACHWLLKHVYHAIENWDNSVLDYAVEMELLDKNLVGK